MPETHTHIKCRKPCHVTVISKRWKISQFSAQWTHLSSARTHHTQITRDSIRNFPFNFDVLFKNSVLESEQNKKVESQQPGTVNAEWRWLSLNVMLYATHCFPKWLFIKQFKQITDLNTLNLHVHLSKIIVQCIYAAYNTNYTLHSEHEHRPHDWGFSNRFLLLGVYCLHRIWTK